MLLMKMIMRGLFKRIEWEKELHPTENSGHASFPDTISLFVLTGFEFLWWNKQGPSWGWLAFSEICQQLTHSFWESASDLEAYSEERRLNSRKKISRTQKGWKSRGNWAERRGGDFFYILGIMLAFQVERGRLLNALQRATIKQRFRSIARFLAVHTLNHNITYTLQNSRFGSGTCSQLGTHDNWVCQFKVINLLCIARHVSIETLYQESLANPCSHAG